MKNRFAATASLGLDKYINHFNILTNDSSQIVLLPIDSDKDFIDVECITVAPVLSLQSSGA